MGKVIEFPTKEEKTKTEGCEECEVEIMDMKDYMELTESERREYASCPQNRVRCSDGTTYSPGRLGIIMHSIYGNGEV